jgi:type 1 glutamine amidotransferase
MKNVLLCGGIFHPFDDTSALLADLLRPLGVETVVTQDVAEAVAELDGADLLTINALRWRMMNHEKYVPHRSRWAFEMPERSAERIEAFVESGGGLLAMHTASICFDTWYGYGHLLGGLWRWGATWHPEAGPVEARLLDGHPIVAGLVDFQLRDEVYHDLAVDAQVQRLLEARVPGGAWQTVAWCHEPGEGRVVYDALGHGPESFCCPGHRRFLERSVRWLLGELDP